MRRDEQVFLAHNQVGCVEGGKFKTVAVRNGIGGACLDTVTAEDAAVVVDVVDLGIALGTGDAVLCRVVGGLDIDTVRRAGRCTKEAGNALFQAIFIALELVLAAEALLKLSPSHGTFTVGIILDFGRLEHLLKGDAHSLGNGGCVADDGHVLSIRRGNGSPEDMSRVLLLSQ